MRLQFREDKATQTAARLLKLGGGHMNILKLVKLVHLADREALVTSGRPITMDAFCSLRRGPIVSNTLDLINDEPDPDAPRCWHRYISERQDGHSVTFLQEPASDQLSRAEEEIIDGVFRAHGHLTQWQLIELTHGLPEWKDPGTSMLSIELRDILVPAGYSEDEVAEVEQALTQSSWMHRASK